jgi:hypothetical protein
MARRESEGQGEANWIEARKLVSPGRENRARDCHVGSGSEALLAGGSVFGKRIL